MLWCVWITELLLKLAELCGTSVSLRCQLPTEDLDALVSITCDEDLANLIEEYDHRGGANSSQPSNLKIRAFLSPPKSSIKKISPTPSSSASSSSSYSTTTTSTVPISTPRSPPMAVAVDGRCLRHIAPQIAFQKSVAANKVPYCAYHHAHGNPGHIYLIHNGNHWQ